MLACASLTDSALSVTKNTATVSSPFAEQHPELPEFDRADSILLWLRRANRYISGIEDGISLDRPRQRVRRHGALLAVGRHRAALRRGIPHRHVDRQRHRLVLHRVRGRLVRPGR